MAINLHDIERAYELGRAAERQKMKDLAGIVNDLTTPAHFVSPESLGRVAKPITKAAEAPKAPKATVIARGVKTAPKTREKGVKKAITSLIGDSPNGLTTGDIIAKLGFKPTSVNATLMGLKKAGIAMQDGKLWISAPYSDTGNSGDTAHADF